jgi:hypothetical protein
VRECFLRTHVAKTIHLSDQYSQYTGKKGNNGDNKRSRGGNNDHEGKKRRGADTGANGNQGSRKLGAETGGNNYKGRGQRNRRTGGSSSNGGPSNGRVNNNTWTCHWCQEIGHKQYECPAKKLGKVKKEKPTQTYLKRVWAVANKYPKPDTDGSPSNN